MVFFFFQAEDGIRDKLVTGVQTCALPISGTLPSMSGLSWLAVLKISSLPPARASHAQPLPNRVVAALASCSLNFAKSPKVFLRASASAPLGSPPPPLLGAAMIVQNSEWL